jgi:hypothetical protein
MRLVDRSLMGPEQPSLDQRGDAVRSGQEIVRVSLRASGALAESSVDVAELVHAVVALPRVGDHSRARLNVIADERVQGASGSVGDRRNAAAPQGRSARGFRPTGTPLSTLDSAHRTPARSPKRTTRTYCTPVRWMPQRRLMPWNGLRGSAKCRRNWSRRRPRAMTRRWRCLLGHPHESQRPLQGPTERCIGSIQTDGAKLK